MKNRFAFRDKERQCGKAGGKLIYAAFLLPLIALASADVFAYQTELTGSGFYRSEKAIPSSGHSSRDDGAGLAVAVDYAFLDIDGSDAPLSERSFSAPQNHVYFSVSSQPFFEDNFADENIETGAVGGDVYFLPQNLYIGAEYGEYKSGSGSKLKKYAARVGIYPLENLRVMLQRIKYEYDSDDTKRNVINVRHLLTLGSGYAVKNMLEYTNEEGSDYIVAYEGAFFFNRKTSLLYGLRDNEFGDDSNRFTYQLGADYFFTEKVDMKFVYGYVKTEYSSGYEVRMNSATLSISGYF